MKRGQIMGLPLVLIFGLIVAALLLFFGVRFIIQLQGEANYVDFLGTVKDIENNVENFATFDEGSSKIYKLSLPKKIEQLCFYDARFGFDCAQDGQECSPLLEETMELITETAYNIYLYPQGLYNQNRLLIRDFQTEDGNPVCVSNGESIIFTTRNDYVGIAYYEQ